MKYPNSKDWILHALNLSIACGERLALVGPSGCGKSSVAKAILQLLPSGSRCEGELSVGGVQPQALNQVDLRRLRGEKVGLVFQDPMSRLNPLMKIGDHLIDTLLAHSPKKNLAHAIEEAERLLVKVGINIDRFRSYPHQLSGGMRQRLSIAMALALKPKLLIADEPTTSLDVAIADQIMAELTKLCEDNSTALMLITHDLALAGRWCSRIAILYQGNIAENSETNEILKSPSSLIGKRLLRSARNREDLRKESNNSSELVLEVSNLRCWYSLSEIPWNFKWLKAIDEISFSLRAGETLGVVGESGCGKSTLCKALMGLVPVRGGEIKLKGNNLMKLQGRALRISRLSLQMVFQDASSSLNPKMSVGEAIADPMLVHNLCSKKEAFKKSQELLNQVGLGAISDCQSRLPSQLSGGQQQRVVVARALALRPKVLICDESVTMLDPEIQDEILNLLMHLQSELGLAILFITHDLNLASSFCDRVIVLHEGKIVEEGPGSNLLVHPNAPITRKLVNATPTLKQFD